MLYLDKVRIWMLVMRKFNTEKFGNICNLKTVLLNCFTFLKLKYHNTLVTVSASVWKHSKQYPTSFGMNMYSFAVSFDRLTADSGSYASKRNVSILYQSDERLMNNSLGAWQCADSLSFLCFLYLTRGLMYVLVTFFALNFVLTNQQQLSARIQSSKVSPGHGAKAQHFLYLYKYAVEKVFLELVLCSLQTVPYIEKTCGIVAGSFSI